MDRYDYNFYHSMTLFAGTSKSGELLETRDFVAANSKAPVAEFNQAYIKQPGYRLERALDRLIAHYGRAGMPFRVHLAAQEEEVRPLLEARAFKRAPDLPCMVLDDMHVEAPSVEGLVCKAVESDAELGDFQRVAFESFGYPVAMAPVALTEQLLGLPHVQLFLGYVDGQAACCSMTVITADVAGLYWVGTLGAQRRRGVGAAITARAVAGGRERGCRVACLQASPLGAPVYRRLGFTQPRAYLRFDHA